MEEILRQYFDVFQPDDIQVHKFESSIMAGVRFLCKSPWTDNKAGYRLP